MSHRFFEVVRRLFEEGRNAPPEGRDKDGSWTQAALARRSGVSQGNLSFILNGTARKPNIETLDALARAFNVTHSYLMTGHEKVDVSIVNPWESPADIHDPADQFFLPVLDIDCSPAEFRQFMEGKLEVNKNKMIAVRSDLLHDIGMDERLALFVTSSDDAIDSMPKGAKVLVESSTLLNDDDGKIYALEIDGRIRLRRVFRTPDGKAIIKADKPTYPEFTVEKTSLRILGVARSTYYQV